VFNSKPVSTSTYDHEYYLLSQCSHICNEKIFLPTADDKSVTPENAKETWTFEQHVYAVTEAKFTTAEEAQKQCVKKNGHLVHFLSAEQLTESFKHLKIEKPPGKGLILLIMLSQRSTSTCTLVSECCCSHMVEQFRFQLNFTYSQPACQFRGNPKCNLHFLLTKVALGQQLGRKQRPRLSYECQFTCRHSSHLEVSIAVCLIEYYIPTRQLDLVHFRSSRVSVDRRAK
jgi:hypothetical protein